MDVDTNEKRGDFPTDDQERADTPDDLELSQDVTLERQESDRISDEIIRQYRENLSDNMRRIRGRNKWSQKELGKKIGLGQAQVAFIERKGQSVSLKTLTQMAIAFNVDPMALLVPAGDVNTFFKRIESIPAAPKNAWSDTSPVEHPKINGARAATGLAPEEAFFGSRPTPLSSSSKHHEALMPMEAILGSPNDPLDLAVVARMIAAAHKRIDLLRQKHGSAPMTRAMLIGVLAAILNASHEAEEECENTTEEQP